MVLTQHPSPNFTKGRLFQKVDTIVIHWLNGDLKMADAAFSRASRGASAHFAVEDELVHQYVKLEDTAWHCGSWLGNLKSVGIEFSAQPSRDASPASYETGARLIVEICRKLDLAPSRKLLRKHSEFRATQCPGTMDLDRLARRAISMWENPVPTGIDQPIEDRVAEALLVSAPRVVPISFYVTVTVPSLRVRTQPSTSADEVVVKRLRRGDRVEISEAVAGTPVNGNWRWLKTKKSGLYIWAGATNYTD